MERGNQHVAYVGDILHFEAQAAYRDGLLKPDETPPAWLAVPPLAAVVQPDGSCKVQCPAACDSAVYAGNPSNPADNDKWFIKVVPDILAETKPPASERLGLCIRLKGVERMES